jgi:hypothetical protein
MIKLDDTELKLKEDLDVIFSGGYDSELTQLQIEYCKEFSFLYNHIVFEGRDIIFSYNDLNFKIKNVPDEDIFLPNQMIKDQMFYQIRSSDEFKMAYKQFIRDYKIDKLL